MSTRTRTFVADDAEAAIRRREGSIAIAIALLAPVPGLIVFAMGVMMVLAEGMERGLAPLVNAAICVVNPVTLFTTMFGFMGVGIVRGKTVRVALEAGHVRLPGAGARGVHAPGLKDGYRYVPRRRALLICVPYTRVIDVRRVTDLDEIDDLDGPRSGVTRTTKGVGGIRTITVRGHVLVGPGATEEAPLLLAEELKASLVTDASQAVAITIDELRRDQNLYQALPERLERVTVYVSVADPDALVEELTARVAAASAPA